MEDEALTQAARYDKILKFPGVLRKGLKGVPFANGSYASLSDELQQQAAAPAKSGTAKKAHLLLEQLSYYRLDPGLVSGLLQFFNGHSDYHILRSSYHALDELAPSIKLDQSMLQCVTAELNHAVAARRVLALRLLASLDLPPSALGSVQTALLSILGTLAGKTNAVSMAIQSATMAACAVHFPQRAELLPYAISTALSKEPQCSRNGLAVLVRQSEARPAELAAELLPHLPRAGKGWPFQLEDHLSASSLLTSCYNVVMSEAVPEPTRDAFFEAIVHLALGSGQPDGVVLAGLKRLAECGWSRCTSQSNVPKRMLATLSGILAPPSRKQPPRAVLYAALGTAISFGRAWTVYAASSAVVTSVQAGPFGSLHPAVLSAVQSGSTPLRLRGLQALLWTSLSPDEWVVTREMCRQELAGSVPSSFIDDLVGSLLRRAELLPFLASASLKFTVECVVTVPNSTNVDLVLSVLETWVMRPALEADTVLRSIIRMLDQPYGPENSDGMRRVHKGLYWFIGEFCVQLAPGGWQPNHSERSIAAQAMTVHLQQGAQFGDWETRSVCLAALVKLAILFDDPLRICVHSFLSEFGQIDGMETAHPIIRSVLILFDKIYTAKAELRSRVNSEGMQWSQQALVQLARDHAMLTELSKPFCPRLPKPYFPLGTASEGLIALAAQKGIKC